MIEPPVGFISLNEAVILLRSKMSELKIDRARKMIAEGCEGGKIAAGYRSVTGGADDLDRRVWQLPHWRRFFETGMIQLELPLLDEQGRPNRSGFTARCTREIFVRRDSLAGFIADLEPASIAPPAALRNAPPDLIRKEIRAVYLDSANDQPNIGKLPEFVRPRLNARGFEASGRQIIKIGGEPEFVSHRRKPGKTKASERPR